MAFTTHSAAADYTARSTGLFDRILVALSNFGERYATANRCRLEAERLALLSDAQLAEMGLKRDEIVTYAFRRYLYL